MCCGLSCCSCCRASCVRVMTCVYLCHFLIVSLSAHFPTPIWSLATPKRLLGTDACPLAPFDRSRSRERDATKTNHAETGHRSEPTYCVVMYLCVSGRTCPGPRRRHRHHLRHGLLRLQSVVVGCSFCVVGNETRAISTSPNPEPAKVLDLFFHFSLLRSLASIVTSSFPLFPDLFSAVLSLFRRAFFSSGRGLQNAFYAQLSVRKGPKPYSGDNPGNNRKHNKSRCNRFLLFLNSMSHYVASSQRSLPGPLIIIIMLYRKRHRRGSFFHGVAQQVDWTSRR